MEKVRRTGNTVLYRADRANERRLRPMKTAGMSLLGGHMARMKLATCS